MRKLPFLPVLLVALAVATMVALGIWQLQRATWKEGLLARYESARELPPVAIDDEAPEPNLAFRRARASCTPAGPAQLTSGRNLRGESGWSLRLPCREGLIADLGWSRDPGARTDWAGGPITGVLVPAGEGGMRIVAERPAPGLQASQPPGPETIPNNHRAYAVQWFLFAAAAAIIFGLALRRRGTRA